MHHAMEKHFLSTTGGTIIELNLNLLIKAITHNSWFPRNVVGIIILHFIDNKSYSKSLLIYVFRNLSSQKLYIDPIYNLIFASPTLSFGYLQYMKMDRGILEIFGPKDFIV